MNSYKEQQKAEQEARAGMFAKTAELDKVINALRKSTYSCEYGWKDLDRMIEGYKRDYGMVELNPDFQRGHVWTDSQQQHYIENALRGLIPSSGCVIQLNCPNWEDDSYQGELPHGMQCIDGLQRLTAVQRFIHGDLKAFGVFSPVDLQGSLFAIHSSYRFRIEIFNFQNKRDLLQHYLDLNTGGTPHSEEEIARVRAML